MENASKALIMAAGVLLGVMIITIGVYIFSVFGKYSENAYKKMDDAQMDQFNSQFLKYYGNINRAYINEKTGKEESVQEPIKCTAHDIISIANLAQQNNIQYDISSLTQYDKSTFYIQVDVYDNTTRPKLTKNVEKWEENAKISFINENSNQDYKCSEVIISEISKRVCYIKFEKIN